MRPEERVTQTATLNDCPIAFRLRLCLQHWHFTSQMAQCIISKGLTWKWNPKPATLQDPPFSTCTGNLSPHISKLLSLGAIIESSPQPCFASRVFLVPKSSGCERVVIDLSSLNNHIAAKTFRMLDIAKIRNAIPRHSLFTSVDLSNAFYHMPIHPRFQKYLAFTFQGRLFHFKSMPFGIKLGPLIFTKIISEVLKYLHKSRIAASVYIDDWLLWSTSRAMLQHNTSVTLALLSNLGFTINWEKFQLNPSPTITYLGVTWNG